MSKSKRKVLICVEGEKLDVKLMEKLFELYEIDARHEIISYKTNIYALYNVMFIQGNPENMDLLQVLKEREPDEEKKKMFNQKYSDILLVFDMDPQDPQFSAEKLYQMAQYFCESTDSGKLFINYPMVESFYHMSTIPDPKYKERQASLIELQEKRYKKRVNDENRNHDYTKFAVTKSECSIVIRQNIEKAWKLLGENHNESMLIPLQTEVLTQQLTLLKEQGVVSVLSTCPFFIADYKATLLDISLS